MSCVRGESRQEPATAFNRSTDTNLTITHNPTISSGRRHPQVNLDRLDCKCLVVFVCSLAPPPPQLGCGGGDGCMHGSDLD